MTATPEPVSLLADFPTPEDVWAVYDFLLPRLESVEAAHPSDADEHRSAGALLEAVSALVLSLDHYFAPVAAGPGVPEVATVATAHARGEQARREWNLLCGIAAQWRGRPGYDETRWSPPHLRHLGHRHKQHA